MLFDICWCFVMHGVPIAFAVFSVFVCSAGLRRLLCDLKGPLAPVSQQDLPEALSGSHSKIYQEKFNSILNSVGVNYD